MTLEEPRDQSTRKADALARLTTPAVDVWVATADGDGSPYLVPVSLAWVEERAVIAIGLDSRTARGLTERGVARLGVGPTRDVVMLDVVLEQVVAVGDDEDLADAYAAQADWDPRRDDGYGYFVLRPERIQAWREVNEIPGRTLMRGGAWRD